MAVDATKKLGYGGGASIAGNQVLMTSGSFSTQENPSFLEPLSIPPTTDSRSRVLHADGVRGYSGQLALDVTDNFQSVLTTSTLLGRRYQFDVRIHDGETAQQMLDCYASSVNVSGASGGLVAANVSFLSASAPSSSIWSPSFVRDDEPLAYWYSGRADVRDWSLTMNQVVSPVYGNTSNKLPLYLKVGLINYELSVTTFSAVSPSIKN